MAGYWSLDPSSRVCAQDVCMFVCVCKFACLSTAPFVCVCVRACMCACVVCVCGVCLWDIPSTRLRFLGGVCVCEMTVMVVRCIVCGWVWVCLEAVTSVGYRLI